MAIKIQANILQDLSRAAEILGRGLLGEQERQLNKQELLQQYERDKKKMEYDLAVGILSKPDQYDKSSVEAANRVVQSHVGTSLNLMPRQLSEQEKAMQLFDKHPAAIMKFMEDEKGKMTEEERAEHDLRMQLLKKQMAQLDKGKGGKAGDIVPDETWTPQDYILYGELKKVQELMGKVGRTGLKAEEIMRYNTLYDYFVKRGQGAAPDIGQMWGQQTKPIVEQSAFFLQEPPQEPSGLAGAYKNMLGRFNKDRDIYEPYLKQLMETAPTMLTQYSESERLEKIMEAGRKRFGAEWDAFMTRRKTKQQTQQAGGLPETAPSDSLDESTARQILQEAGGDKVKAREIARQRGYIF